MAFDQGLAQRIREALHSAHAVEEKKMFGGVCFMVQGHLACGVMKDQLIVRCGPEQLEKNLEAPHTRRFDLTKRPMQGWMVVAAEGLVPDAALHGWVEQGRRYAQSLPPK